MRQTTCDFDFYLITLKKKLHDVLTQSQAVFAGEVPVEWIHLLASLSCSFFSMTHYLNS